MSNYKKAAMFGLDARVALAIFGSLSVITGASIHSAIKESKMATMFTELENIGKAWDQYLLDTRQKAVTEENLFVDSGLNGWHGPYLNNKKVATDYYLNTKPDVKFKLFYYNDSFWSKPEASAACNATDVCSLWVRLTIDNSTENYMKEISTRVDSLVTNDNKSSGRIRYYNYSTVDDYYLYYKLMPIS